MAPARRWRPTGPESAPFGRRVPSEACSAGVAGTLPYMDAPGLDLAAYRSLAQGLPHGSLAVVDRELRFLLVDGELIEKSGLDGGQMAGKRMTDLFPPNVLNIFVPLYKRALAGESADEVLTFGKTTLRHFTRPVRDAAGAVIAAVALTQDISAETRSAETLKLSERRFRALGEYGSDAMLLIDENGPHRGRAGPVGAACLGLAHQGVGGPEPARRRASRRARPGRGQPPGGARQPGGARHPGRCASAIPRWQLALDRGHRQQPPDRAGGARAGAQLPRHHPGPRRARGPAPGVADHRHLARRGLPAHRGEEPRGGAGGQPCGHRHHQRRGRARGRGGPRPGQGPRTARRAGPGGGRDPARGRDRGDTCHQRRVGVRPPAHRTGRQQRGRPPAARDRWPRHWPARGAGRQAAARRRAVAQHPAPVRGPRRLRDRPPGPRSGAAPQRGAQPPAARGPAQRPAPGRSPGRDHPRQLARHLHAQPALVGSYLGEAAGPTRATYADRLVYEGPHALPRRWICPSADPCSTASRTGRARSASAPPIR